MAQSARAYCVDGTNLVRVSVGYGGPSFRAQEEADARRLVEGLRDLCAALGPRLEIDVYFDGPWRAWRVDVPNLRVRFAEGVTADELILDRVRSCGYSGGGKVLVVTADGELGRRAESEGGRWLRVTPGADLSGVARAIERRFRP